MKSEGFRRATGPRASRQIRRGWDADPDGTGPETGRDETVIDLVLEDAYHREMDRRRRLARSTAGRAFVEHRAHRASWLDDDTAAGAAWFPTNTSG